MNISEEIWSLEDSEIQELVPRSWDLLMSTAMDNAETTDLDTIAQIAQGFETTNECEQDDAIVSAVSLLEAEFNSCFAPAKLALTVVWENDEDGQMTDVIGHEWQVSGAVTVNEGGNKLIKAVA